MYQKKCTLDAVVLLHLILKFNVDDGFCGKEK